MKIKDAPKDYVWTMCNIDLEDLKLLNKTKTLEEISKIYNIHTCTIRIWLKKYGLKHKRIKSEVEE